MSKEIKFFDPVSPESVNNITSDLYAKLQVVENSLRSIAVGNDTRITKLVDLSDVHGDDDPVVVTTNNTTFNLIIRNIILFCEQQTTSISETSPSFSLDDIETALVSVETSDGGLILSQVRSTLKNSFTVRVLTPNKQANIIKPGQSIWFKIHEAVMPPILSQPTTVILEGFYI